MTHPCAWASNKGRELHLSCPERVTLWQLAERAATKGYCWPSVVQLMVDTGLARQTILTVVRTLASLGLIRIEKDGQKHVYHVLLPVHNKTGSRSKSRPEPVQNQTSRRSNSVSQPVQNDDPNRSKINTLTLNRTLKGTIARDGAREPQTEVLRSEQAGKQAAAPQPAPSPKAPVIGTTTGGSHTSYREPGRPDPFADDGGESKAFASRILGRAVHLATEQPDTITEDDTPQTDADRARMAAQFAQLASDLGRSKRHFALLPGAKRSASDQQDDTLGLRRPTPAPLSAEQLAAARRSAGIPVAANA